MRFVFPILLVAVLAALAALFFTQQRHVAQVADAKQQTRDDLDRLTERTAYHGALEQSQRPTVDPDALPFPLEVRLEWFGDDVPRNRLAPGHPWIDVAPYGDESTHPPDPVLLRPDQAGIWYNPNNGMFRARVQPGVGDAETLAFYNRVNDSDLPDLSRDLSADRAPLAYHPPALPGHTLAAPATTPLPEEEAPGAALFEPADLGNHDWMPEALRPEPQAEQPRERPTISATR